MQCCGVYHCKSTQIKESDIGTKAGLFEVQKIGDEFYSFVVECRAPKACTILLRGASKDVLNEIERNLHDAMGVARNVLLDPRLLPGTHCCVALAVCGGVCGCDGRDWLSGWLADSLPQVPERCCFIIIIIRWRSSGNGSVAWSD